MLLREIDRFEEMVNYIVERKPAKGCIRHETGVRSTMRLFN